MVERRKGLTWNENVEFRRRLASQDDTLPNAGNILLDFTVRTGTVYTAVQNRSQAQNRGTELSDVTNFYVGNWVWFSCGEIRAVTAYSPSEDADDVVIGLFTLESNFTSEPATGENPRLIDLSVLEEVESRVLSVTPAGQIQIGSDKDVSVSHNGTDGFTKYKVLDTTAQFFPLIVKPVKTDSVNVSTFCFIFSPFGAFQDPFLTKAGIFLDSVPANTKARIYVEGTAELTARYPELENVTLDEFNQGLGDDVIVSTYADEDTWNLLEFSSPTIVRNIENFVVFYSFSDENGTPRTLDVPVDTSATDSPFFFTVRSNNIQSASGTAITLDTGADPRDDDYNGMRLYDDNGEFRDITDYNGTTKVATIDSAFTITPSASDPYDIKVAFLSPLAVFEFKNAIKGQIQDKHNRRDISFSNDGETLEIGTLNYVDTTGGAPTFIIPQQVFLYVGAWFEIIDKENNFDTNNVNIDFNITDPFEGSFGVDFVCNEKGVTYKFRYLGFFNGGWTVERVFDEEASIVIDNADSPYTILTTDRIVFADTSTGAITINLPATRDGRKISFVNPGNADVTFSPVGAELIDGVNASKDFGGIFLDLHYINGEGYW